MFSTLINGYNKNLNNTQLFDSLQHFVYPEKKKSLESIYINTDNSNDSLPNDSFLNSPNYHMNFFIILGFCILTGCVKLYKYYSYKSITN